MNKLILIFLVFVSLTAQAYEPLIREDRVWEYIEQEGVVNGFFDVRLGSVSLSVSEASSLKPIDLR